MNHPSETSLDDFPFDYYIDNDEDDEVQPQLNNIIMNFLMKRPDISLFRFPNPVDNYPVVDWT
jgi:hypothetical protein